MKSHTFHTWTGKRRRYKIAVDDIMDGRTEIPEKPGDPVTYELYVNAALSAPKGFETALHEAMHAVDPDQSEEYVTRVAAETARFVWRWLRHRDMLK